MEEIIPKAVIVVSRETLNGRWSCPGCGAEHEMYLLSEDYASARKEANTVDRVQCESCCRKFETR